jgi:hypothetical protein
MRRGQIPKQLPADVRAFTGRDAELAALDALMAAPEPAGADSLPPPGANAPVICGVTGPGGVGKTALVVRRAHRVRDQFPDGQLYVNLRGYDPDQPVTAAVALTGLLQALEADPDIPVGLEARAAAYRTVLAGRRVLVVLDNATSAAQVRPLHRAAGGNRAEEASMLAGLGDVLLASGQQDAAAAAWQEALSLFTEADGQQAASVKARLAQLDASAG